MSSNIFKLLDLYLFLFLYSIKVVPAFTEECFPIAQCTVTLSLDRLRYRVATNTWDSRNRLCPRSDSSLSHFDFAFLRPGTQELLQGDYCSKGAALPATTVCNNDGNSLAFVNLTGIHDTSGYFDIFFNSTSIDDDAFSANITIDYAPSGVYTASNTVSLTENGTVKLTWSIFLMNPIPEVKLFYNGVFIANETKSINEEKYMFQSDPTICRATTSGEQTAIYNLFLNDPTSSSIGNYTIVVGNYSETIRLELGPSVNVSETTTSIEPSQSMTITSLTISTSPSPTESVFDDTTDSIVIIIPTVIGCVLLILAVIMVIVLAIVISFWRKRTKNDRTHRLTNRAVDNPIYRQKRLSTAHYPAPVVVPEQNGGNTHGTNGDIPLALIETQPSISVRVAQTQGSCSNGVPNDSSTVDIPHDDNNDVVVEQTDSSTSQLNNDTANNTHDTSDTSDTRGTSCTRGTSDTSDTRGTSGVVKDTSNKLSTYKQNGSTHNAQLSDVDDYKDIMKTIAHNTKITADSTVRQEAILRDQLDNQREHTEVLTNLVDVNNGLSIDEPPLTEQQNTDRVTIPTDNVQDTPQDQQSMTITLEDEVMEDTRDTSDDDDDLIVRGPVDDDLIVRGPVASNSRGSLSNSTRQNGRITVSTRSGGTHSILNNSIFDQSPEYSKFYPLIGIHIKSKWQSFGSMVGLTVDELTVISRECADPDFRFAPVLDTWKKSCYKQKPFTWRTIVEVLYQLKLNSIADSAVDALLNDKH